MARPSILVILPPAIFIGLAALFFAGMLRDDPDALPSTRIGHPAPGITDQTLPGKPGIRPEDIAAPGVKIVNYWASWCAPCRVEHPNIQALSDEGIPVFGVNYKDDPQKALAFLDELGDPYTGIAADESGRTGIEWGLYGVPETFVIDGNGIVRLRFAGPITSRVLRERLRPAIEEAQ